MHFPFCCVWELGSLKVQLDVEDFVLRLDDKASELFKSLFVLLELGSILLSAVLGELLDLQGVVLVLDGLEMSIESADLGRGDLTEGQRINFRSFVETALSRFYHLLLII